MMESNAKRRCWIALAGILVACCCIGFFVLYGKSQQTSHVAALEQQGAKVLGWRAPKPVLWACGLFEHPPSEETLCKLPLAYPERVSFPVTPRDGKAAAKALLGLPTVTAVYIFAEEPAVPDELLESLSRLPKLEVIDLTMANLSKEGWKHIGRLANLRELYLSANAFTDDDFRAFAPLKKLEHLSLIETKITARSLPILTTFLHLKELDLSETEITAQAGAELKAALPNTLIRFAAPEGTANVPR